MATPSFRSNFIITGGIFTQVNNNLHESPPTPWHRLQSLVAPAAFHNSAERFDAPRCHPNTRVAVMIELRDLALRWGDAGAARILWLNGPAGAGKSAIAQSFCEECSATHFLLASFFFNRFDTTRNSAKSFVATLAYQIYGKVPAYQQSLILAAIESDPLVFERSIDAQFRALVMEPLQDLFKAGYFPNAGAPQLIVIDGLDECTGAPVQVSILRALESISRQSDCPFVFLVASRPEHDIQMYFRSSSLGRSLHRLNLDDSYLPDLDIELFLRDKLRETCETHPLKDSIPEAWPSDEAIKELVQKSSGQFIYASVVVKLYSPRNNDLPFAELDAVYSHVFSCVQNITLVLRILRIVIHNEDALYVFSPTEIEELCELDEGECLSALYDLQSVLTLGPILAFQHKSLPDYLQDPARSHCYYIDTTPRACLPLVAQCLPLICEVDQNLGYLLYAKGELGSLISNIQEYHGHVMSFSLINSSIMNQKTESKRNTFLQVASMWFGLWLLDKLCTLKGTDYEYIYHHHLRQFPKLVRKLPQFYGPSLPLKNHEFLFPTIIVFILMGESDTQMSPKVFDFLDRVSFIPIGDLLKGADIPGLENLSCMAALRCINYLMHDDNPESGAIATMCLTVLLRGCKLSQELNDACYPGRPFAFTATGDPRLSPLARIAQRAMGEYRERYEKGPAEGVAE